ncbi:ECF-type riboflavin transporter substrate-binding protein [Oceanobacillus manasiensis]|uniref:ECF-type riboflavin transporter substrate-binding protein n=1 Tax=Oceanobacillus manasiensis TaxID=586413 RepID=UPI0005A62397|nr:ECF-type riboflavin transporter substrate-binding protein [Oceanobacillus manasiensis]
MNKGLSVKTIVAIGIGAAIYVILGRFASIPIAPNTYVETTYPFLALMAVIFGPIAGALIGFIGHALKDAISYGSVWWSWVLVSLFVGFFIGLIAKRVNIEAGVFATKQILLFNLIQASVQAVGWILVAPILDILIYAEPANKVFTQGVIAAISNIAMVGFLGTLLLVVYAKTRSQSNSLSKE